MANSAKEFAKKKLANLFKVSAEEFERKMNAAEPKFEALSRAVKLYAERTGGNFQACATGEMPYKEWMRIPFPYSYWFPGLASKLSPDVIDELETDCFRTDQATWVIKNYQLQILVPKFYSIAAEIKPKLIANLSRIDPTLMVAVPMKPKRNSVAVLASRSLIKGSSKTGIPDLRTGEGIASQLLAPAMKKFAGKMPWNPLGRMPNNSYYCPFGSKDLDDKYLLRSSPVEVGKLLTSDRTIGEILLRESRGFLYTMGAPDVIIDGYHMCGLLINPEPTIGAVENSHRLVTRSFELLHNAGYIE